MMNRRRFLLTTAALLGTSYKALALPAVSVGTKLRLVDAHNGAVFDDAYRNAIGPIGLAMAELDLFLCDRRTGEATNIDVDTVDFLTAVMASIGVKSAIVLSAYRTLETNRLLERTTFGVADNSEHLYGKALDVSFPGKLPEAVAAARGMKRGGVGWYPHSHFIHLDSGAVRNWDLGSDGLDSLLKTTKAAPVDAKAVTSASASPNAPAKAPPQMTIGGVKETLLVPGQSQPAGHGRVAGLLAPLTQTR
jgi:uncharacterized protein YcbK (DUF882 family)